MFILQLFFFQNTEHQHTDIHTRIHTHIHTVLASCGEILNPLPMKGFGLKRTKFFSPSWEGFRTQAGKKNAKKITPKKQLLWKKPSDWRVNINLFSTVIWKVIEGNKNRRQTRFFLLVFFFWLIIFYIIATPHSTNLSLIQVQMYSNACRY